MNKYKVWHVYRPATPEIIEADSIGVAIAKYFSKHNIRYIHEIEAELITEPTHITNEKGVKELINEPKQTSMKKYKVYGEKGQYPKQIIKAQSGDKAIDLYCSMYSISLYHYVVTAKEITKKKPKKLKFKGTLSFNKDVNY